MIATLRAAGFDATHRSSMIAVPIVSGASGFDSPLAPWLDEIVFVPNGNDLPDREWERLTSILREVAVPVPVTSKPRELPALSGVSASS